LKTGIDDVGVDAVQPKAGREGRRKLGVPDPVGGDAGGGGKRGGGSVMKARMLIKGRKRSELVANPMWKGVGGKEQWPRTETKSSVVARELGVTERGELGGGHLLCQDRGGKRVKKHT